MCVGVKGWVRSYYSLNFTFCILTDEDRLSPKVNKIIIYKHLSILHPFLRYHAVSGQFCFHGFFLHWEISAQSFVLTKNASVVKRTYCSYFCKLLDWYYLDPKYRVFFQDWGHKKAKARESTNIFKSKTIILEHKSMQIQEKYNSYITYIICQYPGNYLI